MASRTIELTWICSSCGTENRGRDKVCVSCGDPKDPSERFAMPGDTRAAATVTDPELQRRASAGRDWTCAYCGSNVSRVDAACNQCGAVRPVEGGARAPQAGVRARSATGLSTTAAYAFAGVSIGVVALSIALFGGSIFVCWGGSLALVLVEQAQGPEEYPAVVRSLSWTHTAVVDRWAYRPGEGFEEQRPTGAAEVVPVGSRHHHDEQVLDHVRTESYTEKVQDGWDKEPYTEDVACGEDCTEEPTTCSESCSDDGNGFATCTEVCSGGGRSCSTRTCKETRYRDVPRYRDEPRTRQVPVYRAEPRSATWYTWKSWNWAEDRRVVAQGSTLPATWPSEAEVALGQGIGAGEQERVRRVAAYEVVLVAEGGRDWTWSPATLEELARFPVGSHHVVRVGEGPRGFAVDPPSD